MDPMQILLVEWDILSHSNPNWMKSWSIPMWLPLHVTMSMHMRQTIHWRTPEQKYYPHLNEVDSANANHPRKGSEIEDSSFNLKIIMICRIESLSLKSIFRNELHTGTTYSTPTTMKLSSSSINAGDSAYYFTYFTNGNTKNGIHFIIGSITMHRTYFIFSAILPLSSSILSIFAMFGCFQCFKPSKISSYGAYGSDLICFELCEAQSIWTGLCAHGYFTNYNGIRIGIIEQRCRGHLRMSYIPYNWICDG